MDDNVLRNKLSLELRGIDSDYLGPTQHAHAAQMATAYALALILNCLERIERRLERIEQNMSAEHRTDVP